MLAFVLGGLLEKSFRQSMRIFDGDLTGFVQRPISASLLVALFLLAIVVPDHDRDPRQKEQPMTEVVKH